MKNERNQVAIDWWLKQLSSMDESTMDNGEDNALLKRLMLINKMHSKPLNDKDKEIFFTKLSSYIDKEVERDGYCIISVDYHPEGILAELSNELDISESLFPIKTNMWVFKDKIEVRLGYNGNTEVIYQA